MISRKNELASIVAYYLSKYDMRAVTALGCHSRKEAFEFTADRLEVKSNYVKQRRDEFDVLTGSHRNGYCNRKPIDYVIFMHDTLNILSFEELSSKVMNILK